MKEALKKLVKQDREQPERAWRLSWLDAFQTSKIYDGLTHCFAEEKSSDGRYIPLRERRPSVRYGLPQIIVQDSVSLTFGEDHFPAIDLKVKSEKGQDKTPQSDKASELIALLVSETLLREVMQDTATKGAKGSAALHVSLRKNRFFFEGRDTTFLTPTFDLDEPDKLTLVREQYKTTRRQLIEMGYQMDADARANDTTEYWMRIDYTPNAELEAVPWKVIDPDAVGQSTRDREPVWDQKRSVTHNLGFVPIIWIRNLPGGDKVDGKCTFEPALDNSIEIDYLLSQNGRGLKYAADPTLVISDPTASEFGQRQFVRGAANAITVGENGSAQLLEISGTASSAVLDHVRFLRQISMELCGGNRSDPDKIAAAQSGKAMEMMNQTLIWLAGKLRTSYGQNGLVKLIKMILRIAETEDVWIDEELVPKATLPKAKDVTIILNWPEWYAPTAADQQAKATGLGLYIDKGVISEETATRQIAPEYDIEDVAAERARIDGERSAKQDQQIALANATKPQPGASLSRAA